MKNYILKTAKKLLNEKEGPIFLIHGACFRRQKFNIQPFK